MKPLVVGCDWRGRRPRAGFTLVEVVVAMGILVFGMSSILGLLTFGATLARTAELRTVGSTAVATIVRDLEENLFPLTDDDPFAPAGAPPAEVRGELAGGIHYVARTTPIPGPDLGDGEDPDLAREYAVAIVLSWRSGGELRRRDFTTLLVREVPFTARLRRRFVEPQDDPDRNP